MTTRTEAPETVSIVELPTRHALILDIDGPVADMPRLMGEAFARTIAAVERAGGTVTGPPLARYLAFGPRVRAEVGFPFIGQVSPEDPLRIVELPGGRAVTTTHVGPYDAIGEAWDRAAGWLRAEGLETAGPPWETYLTGPNEPGPPVTGIFFPIL